MPDVTHIQLRCRDLVRLRASVSARQRTPYNLEHPFGFYERAHSESGKIIYLRANRSRPAFDTEAQVTAGPGDTFPKMAYDQRQTLHLLFQRASGSAFDSYEVQSNDDGATWGAEALAFTGGKYPTVCVSPATGVIVRAAWASNQIIANQQEPGDTAPGSQYTFNGPGGTAIAFADDSFNLAPAYDAPSRWLLAARAYGASEISEWESWDDGRTFTLIS